MNEQHKVHHIDDKILIGPTTLCYTYAIMCISCAIAFNSPNRGNVKLFT